MLFYIALFFGGDTHTHTHIRTNKRVLGDAANVNNNVPREAGWGYKIIEQGGIISVIIKIRINTFFLWR